jgi:enoyl-CoA hydratase/carnithine racemase
VLPDPSATPSLRFQELPYRFAVLTIDQPGRKVNVLSRAFWGELEQMLTALATRTDLNGLVLQSGKPGTFVAGADLKELADADPADPGPTRSLLEHGLQVLDLLETLPYPTAAIIDGPALGGGLELAMACDFRLLGTSGKAELGLPEVKLGLIPGWGGTQRLPRLAGTHNALTRILSGESWTADSPIPRALVEQVAPSDQLGETALALVDAAKGYGSWKTVRQRKAGPVPADLEEPAWTDAAQTAFEQMVDGKDAKYRPAARAAFEAVTRGRGLSLKEAVPLETEAFLKLAGGPENKALIAEFFAARKKG